MPSERGDVATHPHMQRYIYIYIYIYMHYVCICAAASSATNLIMQPCGYRISAQVPGLSLCSGCMMVQTQLQCISSRYTTSWWQCVASTYYDGLSNQENQVSPRQWWPCGSRMRDSEPCMLWNPYATCRTSGVSRRVGMGCLLPPRGAEPERRKKVGKQMKPLPCRQQQSSR